MERSFYKRAILKLWKNMDRKSREATIEFILDTVLNEDIYAIYQFMKELS